MAVSVHKITLKKVPKRAKKEKKGTLKKVILTTNNAIFHKSDT